MKKKKLENTIWKYSFDADTWDGISLWAIPPPPKTKKRATKNHCLGPHPPQPPYHIQTPLTCQCWGEWKCHTSLGQFVGWSIPPNFSRLSQPTHDQSVEVTSPLPAESGSGSSPYPVSVISSQDQQWPWGVQTTPFSRPCPQEIDFADIFPSYFEK